MAELTRGTVGDRPWGRTLAALGMRGLSGQLILGDGAKRYLVAFGHGAVIGAGSPLASDAAVRVALTGHLVSSTQVADIARRQAAAPTRDEIEVIAEHARLTPEQALRLRRRVVAQRAARTFSVDRGEFVVVDEYSVPIVEGSELDIRAVIYLGARQFLSEARLNGELGQMGVWFQLKPEALEDLPQFGFGDSERAVLEALRIGAGLAELETPDQEQRMIRAVVYSLVSCGACVAELVPRAALPKPKPVRPPTPPPVAPQDVLDLPTMRADRHDAPTQRREPEEAATVLRRREPSSAAPTRRTPVDATKTAEVEALIKARLELLERHADHFQLLGVSQDATPEQIRLAYFALARQLHPDRLASIGITDDTRAVQRLFAEVNTAFSVVSDPKRRAEYADVLRRGGAAAVRAEQAMAEEMAMRILDAEEAFRRGEMALRRDQLGTAIRELEQAIALNRDEPDYHAALAWARFCAAPDKMAIATATRAGLEKTIARAPKSVLARFYLGRVERMLGRDQDALRHFQEVLRLAPNHTEATTEIRVLEARLASGGRPKKT